VLVTELPLAAAADPDPAEPEPPPQAVTANRHSTEAMIRSACDAPTVQLIIDPAEKLPRAAADRMNSDD
jgi:hypothetical protein